MTPNERELIRALEDDIRIWEQEALFFDRLVNEVKIEGGYAVPGSQYAEGLRRRIGEWRELIDRVRRG